MRRIGLPGIVPSTIAFETANRRRAERFLKSLEHQRETAAREVEQQRQAAEALEAGLRDKCLAVPAATEGDDRALAEARVRVRKRL